MYIWSAVLVILRICFFYRVYISNQFSLNKNNNWKLKDPFVLLQVQIILLKDHKKLCTFSYVITIKGEVNLLNILTNGYNNERLLSLIVLLVFVLMKSTVIFSKVLMYLNLFKWYLYVHLINSNTLIYL